MAYGVCKICGCKDDDPCFNPEYGLCWWVDDTHELCSHCADKEIAEHPATQHCVNSKGFDDFPGVENRQAAEDGCPFPDEDGYICQECSHWRDGLFSDTPRCELGIQKQSNLM